MAKNKNLNININLTTGESRAEVDRLNAEMKKLKTSIVQNQSQTKQMATTGAASFSSLLAPLAGITAGFFAVKSIGNFFESGITGATEQEKSLIKLSQALRATNSFSNEAVQIFSNYADEMERATGIQGELILESIALSKQMGASNQQAKDLTLAAANLAATFGGDLTSRTQELGKAMNGNIGRLGQLIPELKNLTKAQLDAGMAADIINQKFSGNAAAASDTFSGAIGRISTAWGDLQKKIGQSIITSPDFKDTLKNVAEVIKNIGDAAAEYMPEAIKLVNQFARGLNKAYQEYKDNQLIDRFKTLKTEIGLLEKAIEKAEANPANSWLDKITGRDVSQSKYLEQARADLAKLRDEYSKIDLTAPIGGSTVKSSSVDPNADVRGGSRGGANAEALQQEQEQWDSILAIQQQGQISQTQAAMAHKEAMKDIDTADYEAKFEKWNQEQADLIAQQEALNQIIYEGELNKAQTIEDSNLRLAAIAKASANKELADLKIQLENKKNFDAQYVKLEQIKQQNAQNVLFTGLNLAAGIAKDGSKEQLVIQKAGAIAQAIIATNTGAAQALTLGPILGPILAGVIYGLGAANVATIAATTIQGLNKGGIATGGKAGVDSIPAYLTPGERVLTTEQTRSFDDFVYNIDKYKFGDGATLSALERIANTVNQPAVIYLNGTKLNKETGFESDLRLVGA